MTSDTLIKSAKSFLGKPYVWGGESDSEGGYDCSGFLYASLVKAGFKTTRKTAQGFSLLGNNIYFSDIKAGDLLFFGKSETSITHCAIYLGNDQMIESIGGKSNTKANKGKGVTISSLYRRLDLVLAKRICEITVEKFTYEKGKTYTVLVDNLNVRTSPNGNRKNFYELTTDGQKHANKKGQLMKGTKVTCKSTEKDSTGNTWMYIPSGCICAIYNNSKYVG